MQGSSIRKISARGSLSRPGNLDLIVSHVDNRAMGGHHAQIEYATDATRKYMMPSNVEWMVQENHLTGVVETYFVSIMRIVGTKAQQL